MLFCLFLLFLGTIAINANGHKSEVSNLHEIDTFCNVVTELYKPHEVIWSSHLSPIALQVKDAELKHGKTGRVYHAVRLPTKFMDRQVKKRSSSARRLMKRGVAGADRRTRKGTLFAHKLARQGIILLDDHVVRGTIKAHDYLAQTSNSLDNKIVAGTRTVHHKVKHTLIPIDKGIVHGSSRAYAKAKKGVTSVDKRIKTSTRAVDEQIASGNMKTVPVTVPMKFFLSSVFKPVDKSKSTPALPATTNEPEPEPEPEPATDISEMAESVSVALPHTESEKYSTDTDDHEGHLHESTDHHKEKAHGKDVSMESLTDETMVDLDMDDKFLNAKHDHDHNDLDNHSHNDLEDHGYNHSDDLSHDHYENMENINHLDEANHLNDHNNDINVDELHDPFDELDHDHEKETNGHDGHNHESMKLNGEPRTVDNKSNKKRYFHNKMRQIVPHASSKLTSVDSKPRLPKNLSRSLPKINLPASKLLSKIMGKSPKLLLRTAGKSLQSLPKGISGRSQMLSKSVNARSLSKLKGVRAFSKKKIPKSVAKLYMSKAPKSVTQNNSVST